MNIKLFIVRIISKIGIIIPWKLLDLFQPINPRLIAIKNELIIEKYLRHGRNHFGTNGVYELKELKYNYSKLDFNVIFKVVSFCTWCSLNGYSPSVLVKVDDTDEQLWTTIFTSIISKGNVLDRNPDRESLKIIMPRVAFDKRLLTFWGKAYKANV